MVPHLLRGIVLAASLGAAWPAGAQTPTDLFDDAGVQDVRLYLHGADWRALQAGYLDDTYYPADLLWRGVRVRNVGVRSRGYGTRSPIKPGLKIDMNRFVSGQRFLGLRAIVLDNGLQDDSLIKERLAFALFQRLGVDVPREAPARLYVNNVYWGAYVVVEAVDDEFLQRVAPSATVPYLFEYRWIDAYGLGDLGDDLGAYAARFEPRTHETDAPSVLYGPLRELTRRLADAGDDGEVDTAAAPYLDLDQFVRMAAVEAFIADIDGLLGAWGMNNFYLYRPADSTRGRLVPWDKDVAFHDARHPIWAGVEGNVLMRGLLRTPRFRALYLDTLQACAAIASAPTATDPRGWLEREVWRLADGIRTSIAGDRRGPGADATQRATARLAAFAAARAPIVQCELAVDRGETTADVCAALPAPDPEPPPR